MRKFKTSRRWEAPRTLKCSICLQPIPQGSPYVRGLTAEAYHPDCRRRRVHAATGAELPRVAHGDPLASNCAGCLSPIQPDELGGVVHLLGHAWHKECRL